MASLVIYYYKFSHDSDCEKKLENWSIFDEVIKRTKCAKFFGPLCIGYTYFTLVAAAVTVTVVDVTYYDMHRIFYANL